MRIALFQPDIAANTGTILRLGACASVPIDVIEPCGFVFSDRMIRRAGLDYVAQAQMRRHASWQAFQIARRDDFGAARVILLTTRGETPYGAFRFSADDILLLGRESAGVPDDVHATADARLRIPMAASARSLNVALAAAMVVGEALRQTRPDWTLIS